MDTGKLYFIKDAFYEKFKGCGLLENKETVNGKPHGRPCCYLFQFEDSDLYWMIPISSKVEKYENTYKKSMDRYGMCDNISFGFVLGEKRAFLPQNLFPVTEKYIDHVYLDSNTNKPITIPRDLMAELNKKARKKIRYNRAGKVFGFTDIIRMEKALLAEEISEVEIIEEVAVTSEVEVR